MAQRHVIIIGAGIGGLMAAMVLAGRGFKVTLLERAATPGGKMRQLQDGGRAMDAGPTVFTLKPIFEEAFASVGLDFDSCVPTQRAQILARHAWDSPDCFDLHADIAQARDTIGTFFSAQDAQGFTRFCADSARVWNSLKSDFVRAPKPSFMGLLASAGLSGLPDLLAVSPFQRLWPSLGSYFKDPRLQQLFGRYATYVGSSPFLSPATLMLIAHVEQSGVWMIEGGMHRLAQVCADCARAFGASIRYQSHVDKIIPHAKQPQVILANGEKLTADAVVFNGDVIALSQGLLGPDVLGAAAPITREHRSLSALTWTCNTKATGTGLVRHNVFFSGAYEHEFDAVRQQQLITDPTVYICAQDRGDEDDARSEAERLLILINAPATGDQRSFSDSEIETSLRAVMQRLNRCGIELDPQPSRATATTPEGFNALLPGTGGALYGRSSHGWRATFQRDGVRSKLPGLYFAGGSIHPGAGVPMAALSGWTSAQCVIKDLTSAST
jgi:1-hydroxycarotenoid 3,4-desaturase